MSDKLRNQALSISKVILNRRDVEWIERIQQRLMDPSDEDGSALSEEDILAVLPIALAVYSSFFVGNAPITVTLRLLKATCMKSGDCELWRDVQHHSLSKAEIEQLLELLACVEDQHPGGLYAEWARDISRKLERPHALESSSTIETESQ